MNGKQHRDKRTGPSVVGESPQSYEKEDNRRSVKQDVTKMVSPGPEPVQLTIQHVRDGGEWLPVAGAEMSEGPRHITKSKTASYSWIGIDVRTIIVVDELVVQRLAKRDRDDARKQNAEDAGDQAVIMIVRRPTGAMRFRYFRPLHRRPHWNGESRRSPIQRKSAGARWNRDVDDVRHLDKPANESCLNHR